MGWVSFFFFAEVSRAFFLIFARREGWGSRAFLEAILVKSFLPGGRV